MKLQDLWDINDYAEIMTIHPWDENSDYIRISDDVNLTGEEEVINIEIINGQLTYIIK